MKNETVLKAESVNGKTITLVSGITEDGYDQDYQNYKVYINNTLFNNTVSYDLTAGYVPRKAFHIYEDARIRARQAL